MRRKNNSGHKVITRKQSRIVGEFVLAEIFAEVRSAYRHELILLLAAELLLAAGVFIAAPWIVEAQQTTAVSNIEARRVVAKSLLTDYDAERINVGHIEDGEKANGITVVKDQDVQAGISAIEIDLDNSNFLKARRDLAILKNNEKLWSTNLATQEMARQQAIAAQKAAAASAAAAAAIPPNYLQVPVLIYHYTPSDFEQQLIALRSKGYTAIDLGQLLDALHNKRLVTKSVVITFDDGFENQMQAFYLLEKYQMKATFYIIDGGPASNWCIGAGRQYGLPSQPVGGCGDAYLTWDQVRQIDASGLVTIGSHTIDHPNLAAESADQQWTEIDQGKTQLEAQLGHAVYDFAYPYGSYSSTTISLVQRAGFRSAVTTLPGIDQTFGSQYTLHRVRSAYVLP